MGIPGTYPNPMNLPEIQLWKKPKMMRQHCLKGMLTFKQQKTSKTSF